MWEWALVGSQTDGGEKRQGKKKERERDCGVLMPLRVVYVEEENDKADPESWAERVGILGIELEFRLITSRGRHGPPATATRMGRGPPRPSQLLRERGQRRLSPHQPPA